ncbi:hypothetical protein BGW37DRAFT_557982 [Umbelopsis sp. PMI_123]|nr:hypothetical protein BGW37DRAFT_557982 [Umbelopsis sp. PMI_123]
MSTSTLRVNNYLEWKESKPGYFERGHDGVSKYFDPYLNAPTHASWTINGSISVKLPPGRDLVECARRAWVLLRYDNPSIAMVKRPGNGYYYKSPTEAGELEEWVDKTFHIVTTCKAIELAASPISNEKFYNYMPLLFVFPEENTLVLRIFHDICDGLGCTYALDNLADLLVSDRPLPIFGDEGKNLSPCMHHALGLPEPTKEDNKAAMDKLGEHAASRPGMMLKSLDPTGPPGRSRFKRLSFTPEETAQVILKSKELEFTVSQTVSAAIAMTIKKFCASPSDAPSEKLVSMYPFDYRYLKKEQYADNKKYSVASNMAPWIHAIDVTTFRDTAEQFKSFIDVHKPQLMTLARSLEPYCEALKNIVMASPPNTVPMTSNWGLIDNSLAKIHIGGKGKLEVKDLWVNLDLYHPDTIFVIWSWNGILNMSFSYNDAYYTDEMVLRLLESSKAFLLNGLQI